MRKKVVMYSVESCFILECGNTSPLMVTHKVNVNKAIKRMIAGTLYRDCHICQKRNNAIEWVYNNSKEYNPEYCPAVTDGVHSWYKSNVGEVCRACSKRR